MLGVAVAVTVNGCWATTAAPFAGLSMRTEGGASSTVTGTLTREELPSASDAVTSSWTVVAPPTSMVKVNGADSSLWQL